MKKSLLLITAIVAFFVAGCDIEPIPNDKDNTQTENPEKPENPDPENPDPENPENPNPENPDPENPCL